MMEERSSKSSLKTLILLSIVSILMSLVLYNLAVPWTAAGRLWSNGMVLQEDTPFWQTSDYFDMSRALKYIEKNSMNSIKNISVAIGMAITSKGSKGKFRQGFLVLIPTFRELLPSFCDTASPGYNYHFYFAYDNNDVFFTKPQNQTLWVKTFQEVTKQKCKRLGYITVHLVKCDHSGRPAWAQNDAMMAAYKDGHDFFHRINDDTIMFSKDWTNSYIKELMNMKPPLVGVVGPTHSGGNEEILTYDFVHRTHVNIFGFYYPRAFPWWYADDWITYVYGKSRSKKLRTVKLKHTQTFSTRYNVKISPRKFVNEIINDSRPTLERYLKNFSHTTRSSRPSTTVVRANASKLPSTIHKVNVSQLPSTIHKGNPSQLPSTIHKVNVSQLPSTIHKVNVAQLPSAIHKGNVSQLPSTTHKVNVAQLLSTIHKVNVSQLPSTIHKVNVSQLPSTIHKGNVSQLPSTIHKGNMEQLPSTIHKGNVEQLPSTIHKGNVTQLQRTVHKLNVASGRPSH